MSKYYTIVKNRLSLEARRKVVLLHNAGFSVMEIKKRSSEEHAFVTRRSLYRLIIKFREMKQYTDLSRRKRDRKITQEMTNLINSELERNNEVTALQLIQDWKYPFLQSSARGSNLGGC